MNILKIRYSKNAGYRCKNGDQSPASHNQSYPVRLSDFHSNCDRHPHDFYAVKHNFEEFQLELPLSDDFNKAAPVPAANNSAGSKVLPIATELAVAG